MRVGCYVDLHELAFSRTFWHMPSLPGQIRIPSLAPFILTCLARPRGLGKRHANGGQRWRRPYPGSVCKALKLAGERERKVYEEPDEEPAPVLQNFCDFTGLFQERLSSVHSAVRLSESPRTYPCASVAIADQSLLVTSLLCAFCFQPFLLQGIIGRHFVMGGTNAWLPIRRQASCAGRFDAAVALRTERPRLTLITRQATSHPPKDSDQARRREPTRSITLLAGDS
jgi:hypothetical protein